MNQSFLFENNRLLVFILLIILVWQAVSIIKSAWIYCNRKTEMSQIKFFTPDDIEVVGGYDRILNYFFLTLFDKKGEVIWGDESLIGYPWPSKSIDPFVFELRKRGITPPDGFWDLIKQKEVNIVYVYENNCWKLQGGR